MNRSSYFALRITHFLRGYRKRKNLTQGDLAKKIGTTKSTVSRIENNQDKHVLQALSMLDALGKLENMDLKSFLSYLDANAQAQTSAELFPWQRVVLSRLQDMKQSIRLDLTAEVLELETPQIERLFALLLKINRLPPSAQDVVERLVGELSR